MEIPATVAELDARVEKAYAAYVEAVGGLDENHRPLAPFYEVHVTYRTAWRQAVMAALGPVSEAEASAPRPHGQEAPGGAPAGMTAGTVPATPAPSQEMSQSPPATKPNEEDDEPSRPAIPRRK